MRVEMKATEYYKSGQHTENILLARAKAVEANKQNKAKRIQEYELTPTLCKQCCAPQCYKNRSNTFCSKSCSAIYNNARRSEVGITTEMRVESRRRYDTWVSNNPTLHAQRMWAASIRGKNNKHPDVPLTCPICSVNFLVPYQKRKIQKTCGTSKCRITASIFKRKYQNGRMKLTEVINPTTNETVVLESSWEVIVAEYLNANNIEWVRPNSIKWFNEQTNKECNYFPDFYLPKYDSYLDPKNPYCMNLDKHKIEQVSKQINLIVGDVHTVIIKYINDKILPQ